MASPALLNHVKERAEKATELLSAIKGGEYPRDIDDTMKHGNNPERALRVVSGELAWCELYLERGGTGDTDADLYKERREEIEKKYAPIA